MNILKTGILGRETGLNTMQERAKEKAEHEKQQAAEQAIRIPGGKKELSEAVKAERTIRKSSEQKAAAQESSASNGKAAATTTTVVEESDKKLKEIARKADRGETLTSFELYRLRTRDPQRYRQAIKTMDERQTLRCAMEQDPGNAYKTAKAAIAQAGTAQKSAANSTQDTRVSTASLTYALTDEYNKFARRYDQIVVDSENLKEQEEL